MLNLYWPHPNINGISDQIAFLRQIANSFNMGFRVSPYLDRNSDNILIENFEKAHVDYITNFSRDNSTKLHLVCTEFLDANENNTLEVNHQVLSGKHFMNKRFENLFQLKDTFDSLISLWGNPSLETYANILNCSNAVNLSLWNNPFEPSQKAKFEFDLYFAGQLTDLRLRKLEFLKEEGFKVFQETRFVADRERIRNVRNCRFVLNLVQDSTWKSFSTGRAYFALSNGKLVISDDSEGEVHRPGVLNLSEIDRPSLLNYDTSLFRGQEIAQMLGLTDDGKSESERFMRYLLEG
jgi:hypothetical protein